MVKIIPKFEVSLNRTIELLESENESLRTEIERLKTENTRLTKQQFGTFQRRDTPSRALLTIPSPTVIPSYLRPTASSASKSLQPREQAPEAEVSGSEDDRSPLYVDGVLVRVGGKTVVPKYQYSTKASVARGRGHAVVCDWTCSPEGEGKLLWETKFSQRRQDEVKPNWLRINCDRCNTIDKACRDPSILALAAKTRLLDDDGFQESSRAMVNIKFSRQLRLLNKAMKIAQDILYHALKSHWPDLQAVMCLEGPREICLGRCELKSLLAETFERPKSDTERCLGPSGMVGEAILGITLLRNTVAHQHHRDLSTVDMLLCRVHKLAVVLDDEKRAFEIRKLRDELRAEAKKALEEIETMYFGSWGPTPSPRPYKAHHQRLFSKLISYKHNGPLYNYKPVPEIVKLAADDWEYRYGDIAPGTVNPEFLAALEKAKSDVDILGPASPPPDYNHYEPGPVDWSTSATNGCDEGEVPSIAVHADAETDKPECW